MLSVIVIDAVISALEMINRMIFYRSADERKWMQQKLTPLTVILSITAVISSILAGWIDNNLWIKGVLYLCVLVILCYLFHRHVSRNPER